MQSGTFYLVGPTVVGKSEIAVEVALACDAEIVGADAFQIYDGLPLLTAQPDPAARARVPHHLVGEIPIAQSFDAAQYRELATARIRSIHSRGKRALVVGGTGLYVRALTHGLDKLPAADTALREELARLSLAELQQRYAALDPAGWEMIDRQNPRRLIRAIEVSLLAGAPFSTLRSDWAPAAAQASTEHRGLLLLRDREELRSRINSRVRQMFDQGVIEEVRAASLAAGPTVRQAIGFAEIQSHLRGAVDRESCIEAVALKTRQYAKRQLTWFRGQCIFLSENLTNRSLPDFISATARRILAA